MNQKIPQILRAFEGYKGWVRDGVKDRSKAIYKLRGVIMHNLALKQYQVFRQTIQALIYKTDQDIIHDLIH